MMKILNFRFNKKEGDFMEIWKDIPNFEGYQVSNLGRVRTFNKITHTNKHGDRLDNRLENLEIVTLKENIQHGFNTGLYSTCKKVKITNKKTLENKTFKSLAEGCKYINRCNSYLSNNIKNGKYKNKDFYWQLTA